MEKEKEHEIHSWKEKNNVLYTKCSQYISELENTRQELHRYQQEKQALKIELAEELYIYETENKKLLQELTVIRKKYETIKHSSDFLSKESKSQKQQLDESVKDFCNLEKEKKEIEHSYYRLQKKQQIFENGLREKKRN